MVGSSLHDIKSSSSSISLDVFVSSSSPHHQQFRERHDHERISASLQDGATMSLIPYQPQEGREIVLRHRNAIVVRDSTSHRLEIRGLTECPTCRRPLNRNGSPDRPFDNQFEQNRESYVDPEYFRMLQTGAQESTQQEAPPSPVRRLSKPALSGSSSQQPRAPSGSISPEPEPASEYNDQTEFLSSSPGVSQTEGTRIRKQAFSPGYFKTFFKEEKVLGKGGKGVVLLVRHEIDSCDLGHYACKRVPVGDDHAWLEKVLVEVGLLNKLSHPNLVSYRHVWLESARLTRFGPPVACAFILQQYCNGGDLHQYIIGSAPRETTKEELKAQMRRRSKGQAEMPDFNGRRQLSFDEIYSLFRDITLGVAYLHSNNYIHRDLKPSNCLLHHEGGKLSCLISDFGEVQPENVVRKNTGSTGTISYCAPEVLKQDASGNYGNFTTKSDIFSLGMILYFMCFGTLPYRSANAIQEELEDYDELRAEISQWQGFQDERRMRPDLPSRLYKLLKRLLSLNATERPSASEVISVMRGETLSFENNGRPESPSQPHFNLGGGRVQNLDSPRGGTPVPEPSKTFPRPQIPSRNGSSSRTDSDFQHDQSALVANNTALQTHSRALSPKRRPHPLATVENPSDYEAVADDSSPTDAYHDLTKRDQVRSPPLLMAPPRTKLQETRYRAGVMMFYLLSQVGLERDPINHTVRLSFFLTKLLTLAQPCWPYVTKMEVAIPLVVVAALDLKVPESTNYALARRNQHGEIEFGPSRVRGLAWSTALFVLHVGVLWLAQRWDNLCVKPQNHWEAW